MRLRQRGFYGHERARLAQQRKPAPYADGRIAAIAHVNDLILVTANAKDFACFAELEVANWSAGLLAADRRGRAISAASWRQGWSAPSVLVLFGHLVLQRQALSP